MCGIAGFWGPWDKTRLKSMTDLMVHRGPDGEGQLLFESNTRDSWVGLGHRRLSIIDLEGGIQPMGDTDADTWISYNGEVYNYLTIRDELSALGHHFKTRSDTEVILKGYLQWGASVVDHLEGMFAFAIWDGRKQKLFLARDRFGIKPLYYWQNGQHFAFASEIKPLLAFTTGARLNPGGLAQYLQYGWTFGESTIFQGICQLLPAHTMCLEPGKEISIRRYWQMPEPGIGGERITSEDLFSALEESVKSHLVADVPVGLTLSGGLDSSGVAVCMRRILPRENLQAYCLGYGLDDDETPFARTVSTHLDLPLVEETVSIDSFGDALKDILWHIEEPIAHPVLATTYYLSRFVGKYAKVVLIGEGSDELFAGYPEYRLLSMPFNLAPGGLLAGTFVDVTCLMPREGSLLPLLNQDFLSPTLLHEATQIHQERIGNSLNQSGAMRFEIECQLVSNQLMRIDKLMMAHSVEARVPFLDRKFAELALSIPFERKLKRGLGKIALRDALAPYLPVSIVNRPKTGKKGTQALLPTLNKMITQGPWAELISEQSLTARGWFDPHAVKNYLAGNFLSNHHPIESRRRMKFALSLVILEAWARTFLD